MMKKILSIICVGFLLAACGKTTPQKFTVKGQIEGLDSGKVYLRYRATPDSAIIDSAKVIEGSFTFSGHVNYPTQAYLHSENDSLSTRFYLENASMKIQASVDSKEDELVVTGSKTQQEYEALQEATSQLSKEREKLILQYREASQNKNVEKIDAIEKKLDDLSERFHDDTKTFIKEHPGSFISFYKLRGFVYGTDYATLQEMFSSLDASVKNSPVGQQFAERLATIAKTSIGKVAPDFTQDNVNGEPVSLSDFRGQYILVDFWASWCGPCRAENPHVVAAYNEYKDDGFTILGVSLDKNREDWLKAIEEDNLSWTQISDLNYWKNAVAVKYGVRAIPANYLIDPEGVIIAKNLRGDELDKKLEEVL